MAGISVAAVAIPVGLAYADLMGLPSVIGLYASMVPMLAYALVGPSRHLIVGPDTATCTLIAASLSALTLASPEERAAAAALLALLVGLACFAGAVLRLGFIANFLSRPILAGYLAGVSITLLISQIPNVTGVEVKNYGIVEPLLELAESHASIHWPTLALAICLFAGIRILKRRMPTIPASALTVAAAIALSWAFDFRPLGMHVLGDVPRGLPMPHLPALIGEANIVVESAIGIFIVAFASGVVTARSFGARLGQSVNPNRELTGFGAANLAAGLFQGFPVTGADSRTAVAVAAGGGSPLVGIAAALTIAVVVTLLTAPLALLPQAALGAVLASAAIDLIEFSEFRRFAKIRRAELAFAFIAIAGVVWLGVLSGVIVAAFATMAYLMYLASRPNDALLGRMPGNSDLVKLHRNPQAKRIEGITIYLFESSVLFMNADFFRQRSLRIIRASGEIRWFLLDASAMTYADTSTIDALEDLKIELTRRGIGFAIGGGHGPFRETLERAGFVEAIGRDCFFETATHAVLALEGRMKRPL